jgi:prolipoprotein diacylglyceryltransferase
MVLRNAASERERRYPTQFMEAAFAAALLSLAVTVQNAPTGALFATVVAVYCAVRIALQRLREGTDPSQEIALECRH